MKSKTIWEFGDFQTPSALAEAVCKVVSRNVQNVRGVLEPCCGRGSFVLAAAAEFPNAEIVGFDIDADHLHVLTATIKPGDRKRIRTAQGDFFEQSWREVLATLPSPLLIMGNPPWVTSADLSKLQSKNLPTKTNSQKLPGFEALTGKSNFDISEWMLLQHLNWLQTRPGTLAMLVKTTVARKVLTHAWADDLNIRDAKIYQIDALKHFGASVDACLLLLGFGGEDRSKSCEVYSTLEAVVPSHMVGYHDKRLVYDVPTYLRTAYLAGPDPFYVWRSGVKHDCSKVMELEKAGKAYVNGFGEVVTLEDTYLYPLYKSSDVGSASLRLPKKHVLVTQRTVRGDTAAIMYSAPRTWNYLISHQDKLDARGSSVCKGRPRFSVFGVGDYTFAPWKVAISGFYKNLHFKVIALIEGKPALADDTINFLACQSQAEATFIADLLNSEPAREFYSARVFWDEKRPITVGLLKRLDMSVLASVLNKETQYRRFAARRKTNLTSRGPEAAVGIES